jgi:hypothetical protein
MILPTKEQHVDAPMLSFSSCVMPYSLGTMTAASLHALK